MQELTALGAAQKGLRLALGGILGLPSRPDPPEPLPLLLTRPAGPVTRLSPASRPTALPRLGGIYAIMSHIIPNRARPS